MAASAVTHLVSEAEYLGSVYRPDVDFVDGRLEERNVGEFDHGELQLAIGAMLRVRRREWGVRVVTEVRVEVAPRRYRVPDVCVVRASDKRTPVISVAPLVCIEVLSRRDSVDAMRRRSQEYLEMGVPVVWIFDPVTRVAYVCEGDRMTEQRDGVLRTGAVEIAVAEAFGTLDEMTHDNPTT